MTLATRLCWTKAVETESATWSGNTGVQESVVAVLKEAGEEHPNSVTKTKGADDRGDDLLREATSIGCNVVAHGDDNVGPR